MKPNLEIQAGLLKNEDQFKDPFFSRFSLRPGPQPLKLTEAISKTYQFPTFYADVTCAQAIFLCSYEKARRIMLHPRIQPVKMTKGRSLVAFSCYEYKNVMNIGPYNEIAMTIPVLADPALALPVLPMIAPGLFGSFGYYVFGMPVTSLENRIRGNNIWGLPKVAQEIDIREEGGDCITVAKEDSGEPYMEIRVPTSGAPAEFDVKTYLYSRLGAELFKSETNFKATFNVTKHMHLLFKAGVKPDRQYLKIGATASAKILRELDIEEHPFQLRFARHMNACFDLPRPDFKPPAWFT